MIIKYTPKTLLIIYIYIINILSYYIYNIRHKVPDDYYKNITINIPKNEKTEIHEKLKTLSSLTHTFKLLIKIINK